MNSRRGKLLGIAIILFAAAIAVTLINGRHQKLLAKRYPPPDISPQPTEAAASGEAVDTDAPMSFTLTAVGDCTLATDITTPQEGSFVNKAAELNGDYSYFFKNVMPYFSSDDLTIVNFEGTLSNNGMRADKTFAFRGDPEYVNILTSSSVEAAGLANNHSSDYGDISYNDTVNILNEAGIINFAGASIGTTMINNVKIALVGINALNDAGAASIEEYISRARINGAQIVILCIHWGIEKDEAPYDGQIEMAHRAVDAGADLVLGSHPHVLQGVEKYKGRYIIYSLGNFCFGGNTNPADKDTVIVRATMTIDKNGNYISDDNISFIPCKISSTDEYNDYCPTPADGMERERIIQKINERTEMIAPLPLKFE